MNPVIPRLRARRVPWNGTALMSYPTFPTFLATHAVFDWGSYAEPRHHNAFASAAPVPLFSRTQDMYGRLYSFSGGTPAVLEDGGRSYLAVGHVRVHGGCLHPDVGPPEAEGGREGGEGGDRIGVWEPERKRLWAQRAGAAVPSTCDAGLVRAALEAKRMAGLGGQGSAGSGAI